MSDLRILEALGDELERATRADEQAHPGGSPRGRRWRFPHGLPLIALVAGVSAAGVAAAATNLFGLADPLPTPRAADVPVEARPIPSTAVLAGAAVRDPDGLPPWDVRVSHTRTGELCSAVGQTVRGRFGIVGLDRRFREIPVGAADSCGTPPAGDEVQVGARAAVGRGDFTARTLVVGVAGPDVRRIAIRRAGRDTPMPLRGDRAFLAVLEGLPDETRPHLRVTNARGETRSIRLSDSGDVETPDPEGGTPWAIRSGPATHFRHPDALGGKPAPAGATCVVAHRQPDALDFTYEDGVGFDLPRTPVACRLRTDRAPVVALIRRLSPDAHTGAAWSYGFAPARTVAIGVATPDVVALTAHTPRGTVPVRRVASNGAFAAIADGHVDPAQIELRARLRDGRLVVTRAGAAPATPMRINGGALDLGPNPPWRDHRTVRQDFVRSLLRAEDPGSVQIGPSVADPAGGPPWAARTWTATVAGRPAATRDLLCATFGPLVDGAVQRPVGAGYVKAPPTTEQRQRACVLASMTARRGMDGPQRFFGTNPKVFVDDPASQRPRIARVVIGGVYPGAKRAEVLGLPGGKEVAATVGPRGAVLAMLGPEASRPGLMLRLRLHFDGGLVQRTSSTLFSPPRRPVRARAVDPKGAAGWVVRPASLAQPWRPSFPARDIDGRNGGLDDRTGEVRLDWGSSDGDAARKRTRRDPIWFTQEAFHDDGDPSQPAPADVARRTLPGRTVLYGNAHPAVTRVTIETSRDVRTVRPSKAGGLFVVVYDGRFTQGRVRVTASGPGIPTTTLDERADGELEGPLQSARRGR